MDVLQQIAPRVASLAAHAGGEIMKIYSESDFGVSAKDDNSPPLTRADLASHRAIIAGLRAITPEVPVLSE